MISSALKGPGAWHPQLLKAKLSTQSNRIPKLRKFHVSSGSMIRNKSANGVVCGKASTALEVAPPNSVIVRGFLNKVPKGGFFFAGTLVPDPQEEAEIAANMAEVAEIERAEKEEARIRAAAKTEIKQGMAHMILREQPSIQFVRSENVTEVANARSCEPKTSVNNEEYLRTEYYKNFHKGHYDLKHFYAAAKK